MLALLTSLFTTQGFEPHGHCFLWTPALLWLYVVSDGLIALAYYSIPVGLVYFVRRRRDLAFKPVFVMFGAFIVACGTTHLLGVWTLRHPDYWLDASVKALTAVFSLGTAAVMWRVIPQALALPSPTRLEAANSDLQREIAERRRAEQALEERTGALLAAQDARSLFEGVPVGLYRSAPDGRFLDVNPALVRLLGYPSREALLAADVVQLHVNPADRQRWQAELEASGLVQGFEVAWRRYDGVAVWLSTHDRAVRDARGHMQYYEGVIEDITGRKRAEAALRESEDRFRSLIENAMDIITVLDTDGTIRYESPSVERVLGHRPEELVGRRAFDFIHPEDVPEVQRLLAATGQTEGASRIAEFRFRHRDGSWRVLESIAKNLLSDPSAAGIVVNTRDVTERKRVEQQLRLHTTALEAAANGVLISDAAGTTLWINPAFTALTGYRPDEVVGHTLRLLKSGTQDEAFYRTLWATILAGRVWRGEIVNRRRDGTLYTEDMTITPVRSTGGSVTHFIAVKQDISERKRTEGALRESEARFRSAFEETAVGMTLQDLEGHYLRVNAAFCRMVGYSESELLATSWQRLTHPEDIEIEGDSLLLRGDALAYQIEKRYVHRQGHVVWVSVNASLVRERDGRALHFIVQVQDITDRKRAEEERAQLEAQLRQAQKMEAIGRLAGGVAHDFNNLLTVIQGRSALLGAKLPPESPLRRHVDLIEHAGLRAAALTRQLLAFSRQQVLEPKVLDVPALITGLAPMLRRLIGEDVEFVTASTPPVGRVKIDPGQLEQVILNLVVNARDAMPGGGRLRVEAMNVELDARYAALHPWAAPGPYVMLAVSDTGVGMDEATQARIFEPFFTTKGEHGTGLGLATVHGIVKQAGGTIEVYSEPGRGTTFKIFLPRVAETPEPASASPDMPPPRGTETILLVEDEEALLHLTREVLAEQGYTVLEARHGAEALLTAAQSPDPIHLLLTDVIMPQLNGRELARRLATTRPGLRVLYMSGYTAGAIEQHGVLDADISFIQKPFTPIQLARKVREALDKGA
jgi:two-component system cell cycle sensor histidine kinase/response regulator CckA